MLRVEAERFAPLAKKTIFYCYFKTILLLSHLFLRYFIWKKPYFNPIIIFYQNRVVFYSGFILFYSYFSR